jgi:hypothetical protein
LEIEKCIVGSMLSSMTSDVCKSILNMEEEHRYGIYALKPFLSCLLLHDAETLIYHFYLSNLSKFEALAKNSVVSRVEHIIIL